MEEKLIWCKNKKNGIKLIENSINLSKAYLIKADNSILTMRREKGNIEWEIGAGYYSVYYSIYSLLMRIGIKSEIHSCSIELFNFIFEKDFLEEDFYLVNKLKELRIRVQYYVFEEKEVLGYEKYIERVLDFNLKCKSVLDNLNEVKINKIRRNFMEEFSK